MGFDLGQRQGALMPSTRLSSTYQRVEVQGCGDLLDLHGTRVDLRLGSWCAHKTLGEPWDRRGDRRRGLVAVVAAGAEAVVRQAHICTLVRVVNVGELKGEWLTPTSRQGWLRQPTRLAAGVCCGQGRLNEAVPLF